MIGFYWWAAATTRRLAHLLGNVVVTGLDNLPVSGGVIVTPNHLHFADPPVISAFLPRKIHFMVKQEAWDEPMLGLLPKWFEAFPVRRGAIDQVAFRAALQILADGGIVGVFPEGHRSKDGRLQDGRPGALVLARRSGAPIVPIGISGVREVMSFPGVLQRHSVRITVGEPYHPVKHHAGESAESTADLMNRIARLLPPEHRQPPILVPD
ncbi:MAG TPA: lysophospholipid acyltransferase family protein [Chloroflexota bacterium]|nr:lysophospholipid acyltransferase family protein [Chloroflexota bacterium]